ncbi:MAG: class I SAM-dependent methyltransferase [Ramlibacter sp.]|nr:class I SAM-dependent methyltransferase [Ramlibacter sp.]
MHTDEIKALFDQQAASYDQQWAKTAPIREGLLFLVEAVFAGMAPDARLLCVGVGTGEEMAYLARRHPAWRFVAVEPSGAMLQVCRDKAVAQGFAGRCEFHEGYLDSLVDTEGFDAATCFLVSQFILDPAARSAFFRGIATRLRPGGVLASSDLASQTGTASYEALLRVWMTMMASADVTPEMLERVRKAYSSDVAVLPPDTVASIMASGGFEPPVPFYQAGLIHAWFARRSEVA